MSDEIYYRQRAEAEARRVQMAVDKQARSIHDALRQAYLERADALRCGSTTAY